MSLKSFWRNYLKRLFMAWAEEYLQRQVGQLLVYLGERGWVAEDGIHVPPDKLPAFAEDFLKGVAHVLRHG